MGKVSLRLRVNGRGWTQEGGGLGRAAALGNGCGVGAAVENWHLWGGRPSPRLGSPCPPPTQLPAEGLKGMQPGGPGKREHSPEARPMGFQTPCQLWAHPLPQASTSPNPDLCGDRKANRLRGLVRT